MTLTELWAQVEAIVRARFPNSVTLGRALADATGVRLAREGEIEETGLAGVVVVCATELERQGRTMSWGDLMALSTVLLQGEEITNHFGVAIWHDGPREALDRAAYLRAVRRDYR